MTMSNNAQINTGTIDQKLSLEGMFSQIWG